MSVDADVASILPEGLHGFHVHTFGTLDTGCGGAGGHYNPTGVDHASWDVTPRHVGDLQQLLVEAGTDTATLSYNDPFAGLFGDNTIVGRAIVVHQGEDDLGLTDEDCSKANGCAGARIGCGVIVTAPSTTTFADSYFNQ